MLGGVLVFRRVAAAHVSALEAQPQMDPSVVHLETFLAAVGIRLYAFLDLGKVLARFGHDSSKRNTSLLPRLSGNALVEIVAEGEPSVRSYASAS
jgi:hypothetical protein